MALKVFRTDRPFLLLLCCSAALLAVLLLSSEDGRRTELADKWKPYKEPTNVFDDFDADFKQVWQQELIAEELTSM